VPPPGECENNEFSSRPLGRGKTPLPGDIDAAQFHQFFVASKLLKGIATKQLTAYLKKSALLPRLQSAYRTGQSSENVVLKVLSDILLGIDAGHLSALVLLDLSAAYDTVDHHILLHSYGITGLVRQWFQSYLVERRQFVRTGSSASSLGRILCGVPQRSVLGPILFLLYTADLLLLIESHGLCPHLYADDTRVYGLCRPSATLELQNIISTCIDDVARWMHSNRLQLNTAKTEVLGSTSSRRLHLLQVSHI